MSGDELFVFFLMTAGIFGAFGFAFLIEKALFPRPRRDPGEQPPRQLGRW